jgi:hypothetical protein
MTKLSRLIVLVEGQTEENFVNNVLAPYLYARGYASVSASLLGNARQRGRRGGIRSWESTRKDILNHLKQDREIFVTTLVDYYGLRQNWPGRAKAPRLAFPDRAASIEQNILNDISRELGGSFDPRRFVPYIVMHEFEGLLFSDAERLARSMARPDLSSEFQAIRDDFTTPEQINDSPRCAPSKRILTRNKGYQKPLHGVLAAQAIGFDTIRNECPLFSNWIAELEQRAV